LIAHAIIVMRNWSIAGSIDGHAARSDTQIQAAHLRDFVQEFQRSVSGHQEDGEKEYYDLTTDPFEMTNTASSLTTSQVQLFHNTITAIQNCTETASCWNAQKM
jgi:hypothetical protein